MYDYEWDKRTHGFRLLTRTGKFVASELRPVYAEELQRLGADRVFAFDAAERRPLMWCKQNAYFVDGYEVGKCVVDADGRRRFVVGGEAGARALRPVDVAAMLEKNRAILDALTADTLKRINEMYGAYKRTCDVVYIGFSGGKDSMLLLDLCHRVLPLTVPVVFSDTDMELPDTYRVWEEVKRRYPARTFIRVRAAASALENWERFGPPSQRLRWCCAVHKSTPAIQHLRGLAGKPSAKTCAFVGVRADESLRRSTYDDVGEGLKSASQVNAMPLLAWGAHELFLYTWAYDLIVNPAYRKGLARVGCLLCPMSSNRTLRLISELYPEAVRPFIAQIRESSARAFASEADFMRFVYEVGWGARQSGVSLKTVLAEVTEAPAGTELVYTFPAVARRDFLEWLQTLGAVRQLADARQLEVALREGIARLRFDEDGATLTKAAVAVEDAAARKAVSKYMKTTLHKAMACAGCQVCASECPTGALTFRDGVRVDAARCVHCRKCHAPQGGCLRFFSRRYAGGTTMNISGINKYMNFGLKPEWIDALLDEGAQFRATTALGSRMVPSAVTWFREAGLIAEGTAVEPTRLLEVGRRQGSAAATLWRLIWIGLANRSPLVKWYVCAAPVETRRTVEKLSQALAASVSSDAVRRGALQSLCALVKNPSLGAEDCGLVAVERKGARVLALTRRAVDVAPLTILYALYVMAKVAGRTSFTLGEMRSADAAAPFVSPIVAFGLDLERMKTQCMGLATRYPDFLSCSFSLGLEEVKVFPERKTLDDVVELILGA